MSADDSDGPGPTGYGVGPWEVLAFGCELGLLFGLAVTGWTFGGSGVARIGLALLLPTVVAVGWGRWLAPASARRLAGAALMAAKVGVFVLAGIGLAAAGHPGWGAALVTVSVGDLLVIQLSHRPSAVGRGRG